MKTMNLLIVIAIVAFVLSAIFFIIMIVVFFSNEIPEAIRTLRNRNPFNQKSVQSTSLKLRSVTTNNPSERIATTIQNAPIEPSIDEVQQTVDEAADHSERTNLFHTIDWDLPDGVSFVLTKNIIICHSDKEYIARESI